MAVIDCFPFFNELDLLEVRLHALAPYVDRFVLCEMAVTHSGNPKPLFFADNKDRYREFNITHLVAPPMRASSWHVEHHQREWLSHGLTGCDGDDIILLSDADEIPDLTTYVAGDEGAFKQRMYYYYFNLHNGVRNWKGTIATKLRNVPLGDRAPINRIRNHRAWYPTVVSPGGWHFSTLGSVDDILYKIRSFAHVELHTEEYLSTVAARRNTLSDPFVGGAPNWRQEEQVLTVEVPSGPQWLLDNAYRYPHLWCHATEWLPGVACGE